MAVVWTDNFSLYGGNVARMLDGVYATVSYVGLRVDPDPTAGGGYVLFASAAGTSLRRVLASAQATVGIATRIWQAGLNGVTAHRYQDANLVTLTDIKIDANGRVQAVRGDGTVLGTSANPVIVSNAWQHVESKVTISTTVGAVEVRVEGVTVLNLTNVNTQGAGLGTVQNAILVPSITGSVYFKDFIIWDSTDTINNNFMGSCSVVQLMPSDDVSAPWTLVGGASASAILNELNPDDDTDYISAGTGPIPGPVLVNIQDLAATVTSVRALMTMVRARKTDGGDGNLQVGLVSGASTANGADRPITTAYTYWTDVQQRDPATGNAWLVPAVNAAQLRLNRTV